MSHEASVWAWRQADRAPSATSLLVLLCLADWSGPSGKSWHPQEDVAKRCGMSVRAVGDAMRALQDVDLLRMTKRFDGSKRLPNLVQLVFTPVTILADFLPTDFADTPSADSVGRPPAAAADTRNGKGLPGAASAESADTVSAAFADKPVKGPGTGPGPRPTREALDAMVAQVLGAAVPQVQAKTTPNQLHRALVQCWDDGDDPLAVVHGLVAYFSHPDQRKEAGRYASAPHFAAKDGKWRGWPARPNAGPPVPAPGAPPGEVTHAGRQWAVPPGGTPHEIGTMALPGIRRQWGWIEEWKRNPATWRAHEMGPPPGQPGCRVWPAVLQHFGSTPVNSGG